MSWAVLRPSICGISSESKPTRPLAKWLPCSSSTPDGVAGGEIALHFHHAGRKQAGRSPAHRLGRAGIGHQRALRVGGEADPQLRDEPRSLIGANAVPTGSPIIAGPAFDAHVNTAGMPDTAATRAASILVTMPPVPTFEPVPPT